jgi:hypothetical protein
VTAIEIVRPGGAAGRVGVPRNETMPASRPAFYNNITVAAAAPLSSPASRAGEVDKELAGLETVVTRAGGAGRWRWFGVRLRSLRQDGLGSRTPKRQGRRAGVRVLVVVAGDAWTRGEGW